MERLGGVFVMNGRSREPVPKLCAGDLGATVQLRDTHTNHTLRPKGGKMVLPPIHFPEPRYKAAVRPLTAGEEDKLSAGLHKLIAEDPSLKLIHDALLSQMLIGGQGEMHIDVTKFRLKSRYGVEVELGFQPTDPRGRELGQLSAKPLDERVAARVELLVDVLEPLGRHRLDADEGAFDVRAPHRIEELGILGRFHRDLREEHRVAWQPRELRHQREPLGARRLQPRELRRIAASRRHPQIVQRHGIEIVVGQRDEGIAHAGLADTLILSPH
jgi:hypothetical protein